MAFYVTISDIQTLLDINQITAATDDYATGVIDTTVLNNIIGMASNKCDSLVSSIYQTPFSTPPAKLKDACIAFCAFALMQRRLAPAETNPYKSQQDYWIDMLTKVGSGQLPLDANFPREFTPVVYSANKSRIDTGFF
jgi:phage gp36-like protein